MAAHVPAGPRGSFERTVAALVDCIVRDRVTSDSALVSRVTRTVLGQHARMPAHLRAGVRLATLAFDWSAALRARRPFHSSPAPVRHARLARWRRARLAPCRELVRFWESLVVHGWFDAWEADAP